MNKSKTLILSVFFLLFPLFSLNVSAQEIESEQKEMMDVEITINPPKQFKFDLFVETDDEKPIPEISIRCNSIKYYFESGNKVESVLEKETDAEGKIEIYVENEHNLVYRCQATQIISKDGCWYFPQKSKFFSYQDPKEPQYIVGLKSEDTCNADMSEEEIDEYIDELIKKEPPAFKNQHVQPRVREAIYGTKTDVGEDSVENSESFKGNESSDNIVEWFLLKLRNFFTK